MDSSFSDDEWAALGLRRRPTQTRSREKLARGLSAAERIVARDGIEAITLPRVAAEADVSVGALYQYLPDREAIVRALVARYHSRLERLLDDAIALMRGAPQTADPIGRVLRAVAQVYRDEASARALGSVTGSAEANAARRRHKRAMADRVRDLLEIAGLLDDVETERRDAVARVAFASADAVLHEAFAASEAERAVLLAELERALRASLGA